MKFRLQRVRDCRWINYDLMLKSANVGQITKTTFHKQWRKTPWFAWNRLTSSTVGRYRTMREARAALEADIRQTIKRLAKEIEE